MKNTGKLYIVGTPIGNVKDITLRAIEVLSSVNYIGCEDTRTSLKLLNKLDIKNKKLISYHKFNEELASSKIINIIKRGNDVAIISDAGMPTIADPGHTIIEQAKKSNIFIDIIPGVSALTTAIAMSGMGPEFTFLAFGKPTKAQLNNQLKSLTVGTYVFFVAPHKLEYLLEAIDLVFPKNHQIFLAKELTKIHQCFFFGNAKEIKEQIQNHKGEFTLILKITKVKKEKVNKYPKKK